MAENEQCPDHLFSRADGNYALDSKSVKRLEFFDQLDKDGSYVVYAAAQDYGYGELRRRRTVWSIASDP